MAHDMTSHSQPRLTPDLMVRAYAAGIFPMSEGAEVSDVFWVDPQERGVFPLDGFHISRSLRRQINRGGYRVHVDRDFAGVVEGCAARDQTWINGELFGCYLALNAQGLAHSVEIWDQEGLAGAVFGLTLGAAFFGESMFSARTGGSKLALVHLIHRLRFGDFTLFDTQFVTDHLISLGAVEISRAAYRKQLAEALENEADFLALPEDAPLDSLS
ncbi:leucyl/phenylalanyl-tRNA--protein transferase [Gymnodinialimonas ceratoperidinii]|uniref:Leucyl/phenylalanyl-tRNA--protein transferase n=1 Tax=Gymnodinialimonas ceratoperidinii TaxID=2856823 RepID=A0A8F6TUR2_9RHOB|nr:leucyl/phenylalanyl-tRNA--protein transferase [Gymnodinialimonas ceratoperidinii]QXT38071.1 leucyl/phenylalanyl-tRNA--protein transferase [Gymnodinialimonas ceratoperidinii]